ncbi:hypothetical protein N7467_009288 [Penicillium canescens]|nr:hypothetical protein N7467_009288 [Penicillium canescens]
MSQTFLRFASPNERRTISREDPASTTHSS